MPVRVALAQMAPQLAQNAQNLAHALALFQTATAAGARLVVFPECAISGYGFGDFDSAQVAAEPLPGPTTGAFAAACAASRAYAVVGLLERDGDRIYNVAALVGP